MSDINKMQLKDILEQIGGIASISDEFINFSNAPKIIEGFKKINKLKGEKGEAERARYLIDNEKYIDKEKLLFCIYLNYQKSMNETKEVLDEARNSLENKSNSKLNLPLNPKGQFLQDKMPNGMQTSNSKSNLNIDENSIINASQRVIKIFSGEMQKIAELIKTKNIYLIDKGYKHGIKVVNSREVMGLEDNKAETTRKLRRLERMELRLSSIIEKGLPEVMEVLPISDLSAIMPTHKLGEEIKEFILRRSAADRGIELDKLSEDEYKKVLSSVTEKEYVDLFLDAVLTNIDFINVDKFLLIIGYRIQEMLETRVVTEDEIEDFKVIISEMVNAIKNKDISFKEELEDKETNKEREVNYSYEDLEDCLDRFKNKRYITKKETEDSKQTILTGRMTLEDSHAQEDIKFMKLSEDEIDKIMLYSTANFKFGIKYLRLKEEDVSKRLKNASNLISKDFIEYLYKNNIISICTLIDLYRSEKITLEFLKEFSEENNISSEINFKGINERYLQIKRNKDSNEDELRKLNRMIEFYKIINFDSKSQDQLEQEYNIIMEELTENLEWEEDIIFYYENGLLSLEAIAEWTGHSFIQKLYDESKITFDDIEKSNVTIEVKQTVLGNIIISNAENYEQSTLLEYIDKGYLSEDGILSLYKAALLNNTYADDMLNKGIISVPIYLEIDSIGKDILEKQTDVKSSKLNIMQQKTFYIDLEESMEQSEIALGGIPLSKQRNLPENDKKEKDDEYSRNNKKTESLINPSIRWAFLKALKCKVPADDSFAHRNPESPFYDYNFFIIENEESDEAQKDSIVIGERFFKNRITEDEYATLNATYIWQYKDYLVAKKIANSDQKRNKKAITQETEGVVYVTNHRPGSWAVSLLYKIAQAKAGESFSKYKKGDERATKVIEQLEGLYSYEELDNILEMARILDNEEKAIMSNGEEVATVYEVIYEKKMQVSHDDEDDER